MVKVEFIFNSGEAWREHYAEVVEFIARGLGHVVNTDDNERWSEPERGEWGGCTYADVPLREAMAFAEAASRAQLVPGGAQLSAYARIP